MRIVTEYFGEVEYEEEELVLFEEGLFGFEQHHRFLPIPFQAQRDTLLCLQNLEDRRLSFILLNPFSFFENYNPVLSQQDYDRLGTENEKELSYYVLCIVGENAGKCRVNLRCPVVVNATTRKAVQVVLEDSSYSFHQPLKEPLTGGKTEC